MAQAFSKTFTPLGTGTMNASAGGSSGLVLSPNRMIYTYSRGNNRYIDIVDADNGWNNPTSNFTQTQAYADTITGGYGTVSVYTQIVNSTTFLVAYQKLSGSNYSITIDFFTISGTTITKASASSTTFGTTWSTNALSPYFQPVTFVKTADNDLMVVILQLNIFYSGRLTWNTTNKTATWGGLNTFPGSTTITGYNNGEVWSVPYSGSPTFTHLIGLRTSSVNNTFNATNQTFMSVGTNGNRGSIVWNSTSLLSDVSVVTYPNFFTTVDYGTLQPLTAALATNGSSKGFSAASVGVSSVGSILIPVNANFTLMIDRSYFSNSGTTISMKVLRNTDANFEDQSVASGNTTKGFTVALPGVFIQPFYDKLRPTLNATGDLYWMGMGTDGTYGYKCIVQPS